MAYEIPVFCHSFTAAADLSDKQFHFVKLTANDTINVCDAVTDVPVGVLQDAPEAGQAAEVMLVGISKVSSDAALTAGNLIGTSADGQADAKVAGTDTTNYVVGQVLSGTGAAGELATVAINTLNPHRGA